MGQDGSPGPEQACSGNTLALPVIDDGAGKVQHLYHIRACFPVFFDSLDRLAANGFERLQVKGATMMSTPTVSDTRVRILYLEELPDPLARSSDRFRS